MCLEMMFLLALYIVVISWIILNNSHRFICWWSKHFFDIHDYHVGKGGDGFPSHFYEYKCNRCGKTFTI